MGMMRTPERPDDIPWRVIKSRFVGACSLCGRQYDVGESIEWHPVFGSRCWDGGTGADVCMGFADDDGGFRWDGP